MSVFEIFLLAFIDGKFCIRAISFFMRFNWKESRYKKDDIHVRIQRTSPLI